MRKKQKKIGDKPSETKRTFKFGFGPATITLRVYLLWRIRSLYSSNRQSN